MHSFHFSVSEGSNGISSPNGTQEERIVHQYHFLMWKDFVAPEYPYAILKFIKVNLILKFFLKSITYFCILLLFFIFYYRE